MSNMEEIINKKYNSVGGWLILLCITLILLSPIANIYSIYTLFNETSTYFEQIKGLKTYVYIESISLIPLIVLSIWSSISLLLIKPYAVKITKIFFIIFLFRGIVQNLFPEIAGLDTFLKKEMAYGMSVNTASAILSFGIWFTYLSLSKRVKNTYSNSKQIEKLSIKQKYNNLKCKLQRVINHLRIIYLNKILIIIKKIQNIKLNSNEIIIISIIVATLISIIIGYYFGETYYFNWEGNRCQPSRSYNSPYKEFHFNYLLAIASFIIFGGVLYLFLNRKCKKINNN